MGIENKSTAEAQRAPRKMKKIITEQTRFVEFYKCNNNHIFPKYLPATTSSFRGMGTLPVRDALTFHRCCPECGSRNISVVMVKLERQYEITGHIFKKKTLIAERVIEAVGTRCPVSIKERSEKP